MSTQLSTYQVPTPEWPPPPAQPPAHRPRRWPRTILLILVAIAAGAGGGVAAQRVEGDTTAPATVTVSVAPAQRLAGTPLDVATVAATVAPALMRVEARLATGATSTGTGIVLTSNGKVLTNAHVVAGATRIAVYPAGSHSS